MGRSDRSRTRRGARRSCPYLAFDEVHLDWANTVHMLAMCDAFTTLGVESTWLVHPPQGIPTPTPTELQQRYGLRHTPRVVWVREDPNRWIARVRLVVEGIRASRGSKYAYSRRALPALAALLAGTEHVFLEFHGWIPARHDVVAFALARRSKRLRLVSISQELVRVLGEMYAIDPATIMVEHTGHSFPVRYDYDASSAEGRRLRATYVGTFSPGRGIETILALAANHPAIDFTIVGGAIPAEGVPANVTVQSWIAHADVPDLLAGADILLMPYTRDTSLPDGRVGTAEFCSPLKMFEYLSSGRSIISSNLPSIAEVMKDGVNCLLAEPDSFADWTAAMTRLEHDPVLRTRLARGAAATAEHHTIVGRAERILAAADASDWPGRREDPR